VHTSIASNTNFLGNGKRISNQGSNVIHFTRYNSDVDFGKAKV